MLVTGCPEVGSDDSRSPDGGVEVRDLVFEVDDSEAGARLVVKARSARFADLPGRGRGNLDGVDVAASSAGGQRLEGEAQSATLDAAGTVTLHRAKVVAGEQGGFALTADSAHLGLDGVLKGRVVKARLREPRRGDVD